MKKHNQVNATHRLYERIRSGQIHSIDSEHFNTLISRLGYEITSLEYFIVQEIRR